VNGASLSLPTIATAKTKLSLNPPSGAESRWIMSTEKETFEIAYSCETKDGGTGFGCETIACSCEVDAEAIFKLIQECPERFDFAPIDEGQKRLVSYNGQTIYLD